MIDHGDYTMARTLGSGANQVAGNGRRVLLGWIGGTPASQSLARDLSLSDQHELLQASLELSLYDHESAHLCTGEAGVGALPRRRGTRLTALVLNNLGCYHRRRGQGRSC